VRNAFDHVTAMETTVQGQRVKDRDHSVRWGISSKKLLYEERIGWRTSNLVWAY